MMYRITWGDHFRAFGRRCAAGWNRLPHWGRCLALVAAIAAVLLLMGGCTDAPAPRGSAVELSADANARAASNARAADSAAISAADAQARADQLTAEAKATPTEDLIQAAVSARVEASAKRAVADALEKQSKEATEAAERAQIAARKEREAEAKAAADLAWTHLCRIIGLIGVAAGALIGGLLCYLTKSITPGAPVGGIIAGTGMLVVAYGSTVTWLPIVLAATVVAGLIVWAITHRRTLTAATAASQTIDALEGTAKASVAEAKVQLGDAVARAGLTKHFAKARAAWKAAA